MSVGLSYQGLPPGCGFIELVRSRSWSNPVLIGHVSYLMRWGEPIRGGSIKPAGGRAYPFEPGSDRYDLERELLWRWCCDAIERFPDLPDRMLDIHKSYTWLPFLLSAKRRKELRWPKPGPLDPRTWNDPESNFDLVAEQAFHGAPQIVPGATGGQGIPTRLIDRKTVNDLGVCLAAIENAEIEPRLAELMGTDMFHAWDVDRAMRIFVEFRSFFAEAARRGEDVLVMWD